MGIMHKIRNKFKKKRFKCLENSFGEILRNLYGEDCVGHLTQGKLSPCYFVNHNFNLVFTVRDKPSREVNKELKKYSQWKVKNIFACYVKPGFNEISLYSKGGRVIISEPLYNSALESGCTDEKLLRSFEKSYKKYLKCI